MNNAGLEARILVLAPRGRDAGLIAGTLSGDGISAVTCVDVTVLVDRLREGAAAAIVAEEALSPGGVNKIALWLESQPAWSDIPIVILTYGGRANLASVRKVQELEVLGNITFLERPARPDTVRSSMRAALRARMRQYEMRRRQEVLTRVNADLEQFAFSASHDLREPVRNVAIYSEILCRRYGRLLDDQGRSFVGNIRSAALRMEALVRDLLSYTQVASIAEEAPEPCDAAVVMEAALLNLAGAMPPGCSPVTYGPLPAVRIGEVHLQQMFQNLIGNAVKYRSDRPLHVNVSAETRGRFCLFSVRDNGIGIRPEYRDQIFGIFKRLHTQQQYPGTGIGLAICQRIAERYGGKIWVESEPDKGSTFFFTVPI